MDERKSMVREKTYDDAYKRNTMRPWSDITHDVVLLVLMKVEVVDFLAFSRVCKPWRSVAISNKNKFIVSKPPMSICISKNANNEKECYMEDFEGRKLKTNLAHLSGRKGIGVTCGYLILFGRKTSDFWLVNPITMHELHFPDIPNVLFDWPQNHRAILVSSPSISGCVFVLFNRCNEGIISFCIEGTQEWTCVTSPFSISDLIAFKGKIYTTHSNWKSNEVRLCELKLYPKPELVLLSLTKLDFRRTGFVTSGENLYLINLKVSKHPYKIHEIDLDKMKLLSREKEGKKYSFFIYNFKMCDGDLQYGRYVVTSKNGKGWSARANMWYFFFDCLNVDIIHE
ncbi:hypothetical protein LXL04_037983 [Taraxacum kok-saghyz]